MTFTEKKRSINIRGALKVLNEPLIMAIFNYTPDSFYSGGRYFKKENIKPVLFKLIEEGADIIDIGAASTRPGADVISVDEEIRRLAEVLGVVKKHFPEVLISVDTYRSEVARKVVTDFDADIINDISSGNLDDSMISTVAGLKVPYIAMHMKGTPQTMQIQPEYDDVVNEILRFFAAKTEELKLAGVNDIIIDPGFGFGKTVGHNYSLVNSLELFSMLGYPVLAGLSRKSMIYKVLETTPDESLTGTIVLNTVALLKGVDILRVHDVKEAKEVMRISGFLNCADTG